MSGHERANTEPERRTVRPALDSAVLAYHYDHAIHELVAEHWEAVRGIRRAGLPEHPAVAEYMERQEAYHRGALCALLAVRRRAWRRQP